MSGEIARGAVGCRGAGSYCHIDVGVGNKDRKQEATSAGENDLTSSRQFEAELSTNPIDRRHRSIHIKASRN